MEQKGYYAKNMDKLESNFFRAFREHQDQYKQAQIIEYGHTKTQNSANAAMFSEITQDHIHALANLATVTQSDCTTVVNMSQIVTNLTLQLRQANEKLSEAHSSIATLTSKLSQIWTRPNPLPTIHPPGSIDMKLMENYGYCWSHG